jgi:hypothetical protein
MCLSAGQGKKDKNCEKARYRLIGAYSRIVYRFPQIQLENNKFFYHEATKVPGATSGFALGRNQTVRLTEGLRKVLQIKRLWSVKIRIEHKKQRFDGLYYEVLKKI